MDACGNECLDDKRRGMTKFLMTAVTYGDVQGVRYWECEGMKGRKSALSEKWRMLQCLGSLHVDIRANACNF